MIVTYKCPDCGKIWEHLNGVRSDVTNDVLLSGLCRDCRTRRYHDKARAD